MLVSIPFGQVVPETRGFADLPQAQVSGEPRGLEDCLCTPV